MSRIVGIDLGTSTSEVAVIKDGKPFLIPNTEGCTITPSIVYMDAEGGIKVGHKAVSYAVLEPENTAIEVKRQMGSHNAVKLGQKYLKPQEISAYILKYLKQCAEQYLGESVEEAVITVPAYFTNEQRVATREAGELAGFKVERIINEPTAAALAYGLNHMEDKKFVLVYDLGGGTLDVTVLEMFEGILDVKASSGNNSLGGKDFDEALMNRLSEDFKKDYGIDLRRDRKALARLKEAAVKTKIDLSSRDSAIIDLPFLSSKDGKPSGIHRTVTRKGFEKLIGGMVASTTSAIDKALSDAGLTPSDIDTVLLVGGSTRIPLVKKVLRDKFGREPLYEIDPDEAVALGAAVQAAIKSGELSGENDIIIADVCPYTLGIECVKEIFDIKMPGLFDALIKRNTTIPVSVKKMYETYADDQKEAEICVYQGEKELAAENNLIGSFTIGGIPPAAAGEEKLEVEFSYDINGILGVKAIIASTGENAGISIDTGEIRVEEIDVETEWKKSIYAKRVRTIIKKAEKIVNSQTVGPDIKEMYEDVLYELKYALAKNDEVFVRRYEDELTDLMYGTEEKLGRD